MWSSFVPAPTIWNLTFLVGLCLTATGYLYRRYLDSKEPLKVKVEAGYASKDRWRTKLFVRPHKLVIHWSASEQQEVITKPFSLVHFKSARAGRNIDFVVTARNRSKAAHGIGFRVMPSMLSKPDPNGIVWSNEDGVGFPTYAHREQLGSGEAKKYIIRVQTLNPGNTALRIDWSEDSPYSQTHQNQPPFANIFRPRVSRWIVVDVQ